MFGSLSLYARFDSRIIRARSGKLPEQLRHLAAGIESGRSPGRIFRPTPEMNGLPFVISLFALAMFLALPLMLLSGSGWKALSGVFTFTGLLGCAGLLGILGFLGYYAFWVNFFAPRHLKAHLDSYYIHLGAEGILRRDGRHYTFVPWTMLRGASLSLGLSGTGDASEGRRCLELQVVGRSFLAPYLVKGRGAGTLFDDWIDYSDSDLVEMTRLIQAACAAR